MMLIGCNWPLVVQAAVCQKNQSWIETGQNGTRLLSELLTQLTPFIATLFY